MYSNNYEDDYLRRKDILKILDEADLSVKGLRLGHGKIFLGEYTQKIREHLAEIIYNAPSMNVKPAEYGVWIDAGKTSKGTVIRECSHCHTEKAGRAKTNYCPECGCPMLKVAPIEGQETFLI